MNKDVAKIFSQVVLAEKPLRIKLLGDSITHGVGGTGWAQNGEHIVEDFYRSPDAYCWAKLFKDYMESHYNCTVVNNGCTGTRVEYITKHFDTLVDDEDDIILCTIGTNNRHLYFKDGEYRTREAQLKRVYGFILELAEKFKASGKQFVFMANIPASKANEQNGKDYWRILHVSDIHDLYVKASCVCDFPLIPMYTLFKDYCELHNVTVDELLCDGLHPNDRGYEVMFSLLMKEIGLSIDVADHVSP